MAEAKKKKRNPTAELAETIRKRMAKGESIDQVVFLHSIGRRANAALLSKAKRELKAWT